MLALTDTAGVILLVLGGVFVVAAAGALVLRSRVTREPTPDIPPAMEPGPSDPALETPLLQKLQGWGVLLVAFFVIWLPYNWLIEPSTNLKQEEMLRTQAIDRGRRSVELFSEENQLGVGCVRCHGPELRGSVIAVGTGYAYPPDLTTICGGPSTGHPLIKSLTDIKTVIEQGRGAMPSWSIRYQGALDDQQINDILNYLVFMSSENVPQEDNICTNPDAVKAVNSPSATPEETSDATGATGATGATAGTPPPDACARGPLLPRVPHRVRHAVQRCRRDGDGDHPVRRQRVPDALAGVRQVDGLPGARGLLLGVGHPAIGALVLRVLGPRPGHADQPGTARAGASLDRARGRPGHLGGAVHHVRRVPGRGVAGADAGQISVRGIREQRRDVVPSGAGE